MTYKIHTQKPDRENNMLRFLGNSLKENVTKKGKRMSVSHRPEYLLVSRVARLQSLLKIILPMFTQSLTLINKFIEQVKQ